MSSETPAPHDLRTRFPALRRLAPRGARRVPFLSQLTASDCGAACLAMVSSYYGRTASVDSARKAIGGTAQGVNAKQLAEAARRMGLRCRGIKLDVEQLKYAPRGTVLHWEMKHFVVLDEVGRDGVHIVDPAVGPRRVSWQDASARCTGVALLLEPGPDFAPEQAKSGRFSRYVRWLRAAPGYWPRVILLSIVLQLVAVATPAVIGLTVDKVLPRGDSELLQLIAIAGLVALSVQLLTSYVRSSLLLHLRTYMDSQMTLELNEHLLELPFTYFQQRPAGDLVMRLASSAQIRDVLTSSALSAVLDGLMAITYFALLVVLVPLLAAIALGVAVVQAAIVLGSGRRNAELMSEQLAVQAKLSSAQVDTIAAIEPIKSMGAEQRISQRFADLYVDVLNASLERSRLGNIVSGLTGALNYAGPLALLLTGAHLVLNGTLGTGSMLALSSLGAAFLTPVSSLVATFAQLQTLKSYVHRIEDILDTPREPRSATGQAESPRLRGGITMSDITFSYENTRAPVLQQVSLTIQPGELVAIVGPSGSGKSTLARLLSGLITPTAGSIGFDGIAQSQWDPSTLRSLLGMVTQDPRLLASSVRDNICLFDESVALPAIEAAAKLAEIHDDVLALPLGYDTVLSDGGGSLSGGQRQRIALARAVLRTPAVLVLDEATSQLDTVTERRVQEHLQKLACTRVVIAHRLSTIRNADRIVVLDRGRLVDVGRHAELVVRCRLYRELVSAQMVTAAEQQPLGAAG